MREFANSHQSQKSPWHGLLILGANGQVGRSLIQQCNDRGIQHIAWNRAQADLRDPDKLIVKLQQLKPKVVINAAAFTNMDAAEVEPGRNENQIVNAEAPRRLAGWCHDQNSVFVHYSTDAVFAGDGELAYKETDPTDPVNAYGEAKARGERGVLESGGKHLTFRTSWVFSERGANFLNTIIALAREKQTLKVVADQWGSPTYAWDLAHFTLLALDRTLAWNQFPSGIYHLSNTGWTSRFSQAQFIISALKQRNFELAAQSVEPIASEEYTRPARRAKNSRLDIGKFVQTFACEPTSWQNATLRCLEKKFSQGQKESEIHY